MITEFQKMKASREKTAKAISDKIDYRQREINDSEREFDGYKIISKRACDALLVIGRSDIADRIEKCDSGARCQSIWCKRCRNTAALTFENIIRNAIEQKYTNNFDGQYLKEKLYHVTGHMGICRVSASEVYRMIANDHKKWIKMRGRKASDQIWARVTYEFELVNLKFLEEAANNTKKQLQISQMKKIAIDEGRLGDKDNLVMYCHWHGVWDATEEQINKVVGSLYSLDGKKLYKTSDSGLFVQKMRKDFEFDKSIKKISSYNFKSAVRFKHSFKGDDFKERITKNEIMTNEELGKLIEIYDEAQGKNWQSLHRSIG
jgi:hypothetical protein